MQGFLSNSLKFLITISSSTEFTINELTNLYRHLISAQNSSEKGKKIIRHSLPHPLSRTVSLGGEGVHQLAFFQPKVIKHPTQDASK